jgi:hypothetical protein
MEFEVRLTCVNSSNGIPQQVPSLAEREVWFIEACKGQRDHQWTANSCGRSKPAAQADEDLRFLRAWLKGEVLPPRFDGSVFDPNERKYLAGVSIYLRSAKQTFSTVTELAGCFPFSGPAARYLRGFGGAALGRRSVPDRFDAGVVRGTDVFHPIIGKVTLTEADSLWRWENSPNRSREKR